MIPGLNYAANPYALGVTVTDLGHKFMVETRMLQGAAGGMPTLNDVIRGHLHVAGVDTAFHDMRPEHHRFLAPARKLTLAEAKMLWLLSRFPLRIVRENRGRYSLKRGGPERTVEHYHAVDVDTTFATRTVNALVADDRLRVFEFDEEGRPQVAGLP